MSSAKGVELTVETAVLATSCASMTVHKLATIRAAQKKHHAQLWVLSPITGVACPIIIIQNVFQTHRLDNAIKQP